MGVCVCVCVCVCVYGCHDIPPWGQQGILGMAAFGSLLDIKGDKLEAESFIARAQFFVKWWMDHGIVSCASSKHQPVMSCLSLLLHRTQMTWLLTTD